MDTSFGIQQKGKRNLITDVAGITVGHCTLADGDVQTGVTALLPHQGDLFHDRCPAAVHVINGFGKSAGLVQVQELGYLETPLILTNTLSVARPLRPACAICSRATTRSAAPKAL